MPREVLQEPLKFIKISGNAAETAGNHRQECFIRMDARSIAVLMLHPGCNMWCSYCVTENSMSSMHYEQALHVLEEAARRGIGNVVLGGGEPFTWGPGAMRLAREAKRRGFVVQIGTNGAAPPPGYECAEAVDRYVLPLDAATAPAHDALRHYPGGHHRLIVERLARLREAGKSVTVSTVVTALNLGEMETLAHFLNAYVHEGGRLHAWHLYRFLPQGRGGARNAPHLRVGGATYDATCARAKAAARGYAVFKRKDMQHSRTVDFFWHEGERLCIGSEYWGAASGADPSWIQRPETLALASSSTS